MMDAQAVLIIGGVTGSLAKVLSMTGVNGSHVSWAVFGVSILTVGLWGYSHEPAYSRTIVWDYFAGWVATLLTAAGAFKTIEEAPKTQAVRSMTGQS